MATLYTHTHRERERVEHIFINSQYIYGWQKKEIVAAAVSCSLSLSPFCLPDDNHPERIRLIAIE